MKNLLFIINPHSGRGKIKENLMECLNIFSQEGYITSVYLTQEAGQAEQIAKQYASAFSRIVAAGGDGTLNEVVNGLMGLEKCPEIGYIPVGTTNDFGNSLGIPSIPEDAAKIAVTGTIFNLDVGRFDARYFTYIAAFGAFTGVSYSTPQPTKNLLGHAAYVLEGIRSLPSIKAYHLKLTCEETTIEGDFIYGMVTNATTVGGVLNVSNEEVEMDDGLFEVLLIHQPENPMQLQGIITLLLAQDLSSNAICHFKTKTVTFEMDEAMPWTLDGEYGGTPKTVRIENCRRVLPVVVADSQDN